MRFLNYGANMFSIVLICNFHNNFISCFDMWHIVLQYVENTKIAIYVTRTHICGKVISVWQLH